jgi:hypothetical protein
MSDSPILIDLTASFAHVTSPTPFGVYDADSSFQTDANGMVRLVYSQLGGNVLGVELTNKDVYSSLEQAMLEYSAIVNSYHAKSILSNLIGSQTGSLTGKQNKVPRMDLASAKRAADAYSSEAVVGGSRTLHSASITLNSGQQHYDLNVLLSSSGLVVPPSQRAEIREIFHFSPTAAYRFFDTSSAVNYLHNQFSFESFTPETVFYLLPIWEDVLRAQQLEQSHRIRRSNYSYNIVNNVLTLFPMPTAQNTLFFTYYLVGDDSVFNENDPMTNGVSNLSNVPFGNISYTSINSMGRQWVRRFSLALTKEVLGQIRGKVGAVPIPNGDLTLNGPALVQEAQTEKEMLRNELKAWLESMTYDKLAEEEANQAENLSRQLSKVPLGIFVG